MLVVSALLGLNGVSVFNQYAELTRAFTYQASPLYITMNYAVVISCMLVSVHLHSC